MKIDKEITHVEIVDSIDELNKKLEDNYILIETLKHQKKDYDGYFEYIEFIIGR